MKQFMSAGGWTFPVMMASDEIAGAYGIQAIPTVVLIDSESRMVDTVVGGASASQLSAMVDDLIP